MRIPVLTYQSLRGPGREDHSNDHVALESDLKIGGGSAMRSSDYVPSPLAPGCMHSRGSGAPCELQPLLLVREDD